MSSPLHLLALPLQPMCAIRRDYRSQPPELSKRRPRRKVCGVHFPAECRRVRLRAAGRLDDLGELHAWVVAFERRMLVSSRRRARAMSCEPSSSQLVQSA